MEESMSGDDDTHWFSDEYLEAAEKFAHAKEQVRLYRQVAHTSAWAKEQVDWWNEIMEQYRWIEPGRSK
jgi:hypothetical protein